MTGKRVIALLAVMTWLAVLNAAGAVESLDPYESDPLRLIALRDRHQPLGTTTVNVWICPPPGSTGVIDAHEAARILETEHAPLLTWLSQGRHGIEIGAVATLAAVDYRWSGIDLQVCPGRPEYQGMEDPYTGFAPLRYRKAVVGSLSSSVDLAQEPAEANLAWAGQISPGVFGESILFLNTHLTGRGTIPATKTRFYEVGEAYTSVNTDFFSGYDLGTSAVNRYSLGWIDPEDVAVHPGGTGRYRIGALGHDHPQMLVFPSSRSPHVFDSLGVRLKQGHDANLPQEGVEVIRVDQRSSACPDWAKRESPLCVRSYRSQWWLKGHRFFDVGAVIDLDEFRVRVVERREDSMVLEVTTLFDGRFSDMTDAYRGHREDIETLAAAGITVGCNRSGTNFCPGQTVNRAQMAAFILRATGVEIDPKVRETGFEDVDPLSWFAPHVAKITELGIIPPRSSIGFDPGGPVTRADMAWFLIRAIASLDPVAEPAGLFADVEDPDLEPAVEALYSAGVTKGCGEDPLIYCPDDPVNRAQMASFLVRAFKPAS